MNNAQGMTAGNESRSFRALHATLVARIARMQEEEVLWYGAPLGAEVVIEVAVKRVLMSLHSPGAPSTVPVGDLASLLGKDIAKKSIEALSLDNAVPAWWTDETAAARWAEEVAAAWWIDETAERPVWDWTGETAESAEHCRSVGVQLIKLLIRSSELIVVETDATSTDVVSLHPEWASRLPQYEGSSRVH